MVRYYFDVHDGDQFIHDGTGVDLQDRAAAGRYAISRLRVVGGEGPPSGDLRRTFAIHVRDDFDKPVLKAVSSFAFQWLEE
jgi:hypothetical protein